MLGGGLSLCSSTERLKNPKFGQKNDLDSHGLRKYLLKVDPDFVDIKFIEHLSENAPKIRPLINSKVISYSLRLQDYDGKGEVNFYDFFDIVARFEFSVDLKRRTLHKLALLCDSLTADRSKIRVEDFFKALPSVQYGNNFFLFKEIQRARIRKEREFSENRSLSLASRPITASNISTSSYFNSSGNKHLHTTDITNLKETLDFSRGTILALATDIYKKREKIIDVI